MGVIKIFLFYTKLAISCACFSVQPQILLIITWKIDRLHKSCYYNAWLKFIIVVFSKVQIFQALATFVVTSSTRKLIYISKRALRINFNLPKRWVQEKCKWEIGEKQHYLKSRDNVRGLLLAIFVPKKFCSVLLTFKISLVHSNVSPKAHLLLYIPMVCRQLEIYVY